MNDEFDNDYDGNEILDINSVDDDKNQEQQGSEYRINKHPRGFDIEKLIELQKQNRFTDVEVEFTKLVALGKTVAESCKLSGLSKREANILVRSDRYKSLLLKSKNEVVKDVKSCIRGLAAKAISVIDKALDSEDEKIRVMQANKVMEYLGIKRDAEKDSAVNYTAKETKEFMTMLKELKQIDISKAARPVFIDINEVADE